MSTKVAGKAFAQTVTSPPLTGGAGFGLTVKTTAVRLVLIQPVAGLTVSL